MIKITTQGILLFIIIFSINAQNNFIKPSSVWKIDRMINVTSRRDSRNPTDETYKLFVCGDTVINFIKYFKLCKTGIMYLGPPLEYKNQYIGAVRESGGRVYFISGKSLKEQVLYDYNLKVNDTIKSIVANGKVVLGIDTLENGRRRFHITKHMDHAMEAYIIEGIGSTGGLLNEPPVGHYMFDDSYLVCYAENYKIVYKGIDILNCGYDELTCRFPVNPKGVWYMNHLFSCYPEAYTEGEDVFRYFINSDTIIHDTVYYKLYKSGTAYYEEPFDYENVYCGALRNSDNKFYYIEKNKAEEILLYDFDWQVGDTIGKFYNNPVRVSKIDTFPDGRKKILIESILVGGCSPRYELLEGIGHWGGIMEDPPCLHMCKWDYFLSCYKVNDNLIYSNNYGFFNFGCQKQPVYSINELEYGVKIYPIPSRDIINIEVNIDNFKIQKIEIYNISGSLVYVAAKNSNKADISGLKKGIYFLKVISDKDSLSGKFIKE